jgi:hypothetical protein
MQTMQDDYDKNWWNKGYKLEYPLVLSLLNQITENSFIKRMSHEDVWNKPITYIPPGMFFMVMPTEDIRHFLQLCQTEIKDLKYDTSLNQLRWLIAFGQGQTDISAETVTASAETLHFLLYIEILNRHLAIHPRYASYTIFEEDMHGEIYPGLTCKELYADFKAAEFDKLKGKIINAIRPT